MQQFGYEKVKDPLFFKENTLEAHSDHGICQEEGVSRFRYFLDGPWKFSYAKNYGSVVPGFERMEYDCKSWADIRVPACPVFYGITLG